MAKTAALLARYLWRAYQAVLRPVGHTPFDSVALYAMVLSSAEGVALEMADFHEMMLAASVLGLADGPTEVHKVTVARQILRDYRPSDDLWPTQHLPKRMAAAREKFAEYLEHEVGNL